MDQHVYAMETESSGLPPKIAAMSGTVEVSKQDLAVAILAAATHKFLSVAFFGRVESDKNEQSVGLDPEHVGKVMLSLNDLIKD